MTCGCGALGSGSSMPPASPQLIQPRRSTLDTADNGVIVIFSILILGPIALVVLALLVAAIL